MKITEVKIEDIRIVKNIRDDNSDLDDLTNSIRVHGLLQPILIRESASNKSRYDLVAGHRRFKAVQILKWETVPAVIEKFDKKHVIQLTENLHRKNMSMIEESECIFNLNKQLKVPVSKLAEIVGKDPAWIDKRIKYHTVREFIRDDSIIPKRLLDKMTFDIAWIVGKYDKKYWIQMCSYLLGKRWYPERIKEYCKSVVNPNYKPKKKKEIEVLGDAFSVKKNDSELIIKIFCTTLNQYKKLLDTLQVIGGEIL